MRVKTRWPVFALLITLLIAAGYLAGSTLGIPFGWPFIKEPPEPYFWSAQDIVENAKDNPVVDAHLVLDGVVNSESEIDDPDAYLILEMELKPNYEVYGGAYGGIAPTCRHFIDLVKKKEAIKVGGYNCAITYKGYRMDISNDIFAPWGGFGDERHLGKIIANWMREHK